MTVTAERLFGWTPFRAAWHGPQMLVDWCHFGGRRMTEPFFYETVANAMRNPFNLVFQQRTPIEGLAELPPGLAPSGFIFHMSRCGSTLVAQTLAAFESNIVVSEASPLRAALRAADTGRATPEQAQAWVAGLVNAYTQPRFSYETHAVVKFMAADVLDVALVLRAFPNVPWLFLYRNPLEILASQKTMGGADTIPGTIAPHRLGLEPTAPFTMKWEAYQLHVLTALGRAALTAHEGAGAGMGRRGLILDYAALPEALETLILPHFGLAADERARASIRASVQRNAKAPGQPFVADAAAKREAAAPWAALAATITGDTFAALAHASAR